MLVDKLKDYDILLASTSPRRKQLLAEMGLSFRTLKKAVEEKFPAGLSPTEATVYLSRLKSLVFHNDELKENTLLITADTIVCLDSKILGKPKDEKEAREILQQLSSKKHEVITGISLRIKDRIHSFFATTDVYFKSLSNEEINYYIKHYQPFDKAGAYGIQEWIGHTAIEKIEGSYYNVMGLPTYRLYNELESFIDGQNKNTL